MQFCEIHYKDFCIKKFIKQKEKYGLHWDRVNKNGHIFSETTLYSFKILIPCTPFLWKESFNKYTKEHSLWNESPTVITTSSWRTLLSICMSLHSYDNNQVYLPHCLVKICACLNLWQQSNCRETSE